LEETTGAEDEDVLERAFEEERVLLTEDKDFGELVFRLRKRAIGIVLLRIDIKDRDLKWPRMKKLLDNHAGRLPGHFVVVDRDKFRIRPLVFKL
jgi:predicted nuclease of predicted toxin-antitoxin system